MSETESMLLYIYSFCILSNSYVCKLKLMYHNLASQSVMLPRAHNGAAAVASELDA